MTRANGYDPTTLNHWLWWKLLCNEADGNEFQKLFEKVMQRIEHDFVAVRPYGRDGDWKCDGVFRKKGTVFQVYSPDEYKQTALVKKIREDLAGAAKRWSRMKSWVFVYNVRRGLPPRVPDILQQMQAKYPNVVLDHMSSDHLWDRLRKMDLQVRCEVLGPPSGYDGFDLRAIAHVADACPIGGRFVIVQDILSPIDVHKTLDALGDSNLLGPPLRLRANVGRGLWTEAARSQQLLIADALIRSKTLRPRFAVFSLAPIALAVHLGYLLSDRVEVLPFQYHRDCGSWAWDSSASADTRVSVTGAPHRIVTGAADAVIRVSLSAHVLPAETRCIVSDAAVEIDVSVATPDEGWLRSPEQLTVIAQRFREVLKTIRVKVPNCRRVHLFAAVPTPAAITIGRAVNPRMNPPLVLYEYSRQRKPRYREVLTLAEEGCQP